VCVCVFLSGGSLTPLLSVPAAPVSPRAYCAVFFIVPNLVDFCLFFHSFCLLIQAPVGERRITTRRKMKKATVVLGSSALISSPPAGTVLGNRDCDAVSSRARQTKDLVNDQSDGRMSERKKMNETKAPKVKKLGWSSAC
jgi:hypothetical protein